MSEKTEQTPAPLRAVALAPAQIEVGDRLRAVKPHLVEAMARDMELQGQLQPVLVIEAETAGKYLLVDGAQRLAALTSIRAAFVEAVVLPKERGPELREYAAIMANLMRGRLTKLERAEYLAELRDVWRRMEISAQHGGDRRSARVRLVKEREAEESGKSAILALSDQVADEVGLSRRAFFRATAIVSKIDAALRARLHGSWIADHQASLLALSELFPQMQARICDLLLADPPEATSVADAVLIAQGRPLPRPEDQLYARVTSNWSRLPAKSRGAFLDQHRREIVDHARRQGWTI